MLKIYNSLSQQKEIFVPMHAGKASLYVCGMTTYDYCHIGHIRMLMAFDVIARYLQFSGYALTFVRNITDIDDKIIKRAHENNEEPAVLANRFIDIMHEDFTGLNLLNPTHEPRATEFIPQMIDIIEKLIAKDFAYVAKNGDVCYRVRAFPQYGCLSHRNIDELESGARVEVVSDKDDPLDFVLWKTAKPGEPAWESPWGLGRPGWHIECSAMSMQLLGEEFDIHGGGKDLIFPHHENEIAQSVAATGKSYAHYWLHNGFLQLNKEKMSKSLGNILNVRDALKKYSSEALRYFYLSSHYRSPVSYAEDAFPAIHAALSRLYTALNEVAAGTHNTLLQNTRYRQRFIDAMDDDFNTPIALTVLFDLAHEIQRCKDARPDEAIALAHELKTLGNVLGLLAENPHQFLQGNVDHSDAEKITVLINARNAARASKNWQEADRIRDELTQMSVVLEDGAEGTSWKKVT